MHEDLLSRHVIDPWFPRSIDREYGGFLCDFDRKWGECGPHQKLLEFQARQTLAAAELSIRFPGEAALEEAVAAGFAFLHDIAWDQEYGGWHAITDRSGAPLQPELKHSHGMAYAAQACFGVYAATGNRSALDLANSALEWLDGNARDPVNLGYFGPLSRDGTAILTPTGSESLDQIGTPFGLKDMNVNCDFYELLAYAATVEGSHSFTQARLDEIRHIVLSHYAAPGKTPWHLWTPDWTPAGSECRPGTAVQTAARLLEDAARSAAQTAAARHLFESALGLGWDRYRHALRYRVGVGAAAGDTSNLQWWAQLELLKCTAYLLHLDPDDEHMRAWKEKAWTLVSRGVLDERFGGSRAIVRPTIGWRRYLQRLPDRDARKAYAWKDASHDARVLIGLSDLDKNGIRSGPPIPQDNQLPDAASC